MKNLIVLNDMGGSVMNVSDIPCTLRSQMKHHEPIVCFEPGIAKREGAASRFVKDLSPTLRANAGDNQTAVCYSVDSHPMDSRFEIDGDISPTVTAKLAKGSADGPLVIVDKTYAIEGNVVDRVSAKNGKGWCEDISPTLNTQDRHAICFQLCGDRDDPSVSVSDTAYCIPANPMSDRGQAVCYEK